MSFGAEQAYITELQCANPIDLTHDKSLIQWAQLETGRLTTKEIQDPFQFPCFRSKLKLNVLVMYSCTKIIHSPLHFIIQFNIIFGPLKGERSVTHWPLLPSSNTMIEVMLKYSTWNQFTTSLFLWQSYYFFLRSNNEEEGIF